jgi:lipoprotein-releasing system permease protein
MLERLFILRYMYGSSKASVVKTIALLSIFGISLGVLAMVVVLSVMQGFDDAIKSRLLGSEPHIIIQENSPTAQAQIQKILGSHGQGEAYSKQDVIVRTVDGIFAGALAQGEEPRGFRALGKRVRHNVEVTDTPTGVVATSKNLPSTIDFKLSHKEIAIGQDLARSIGVFEGDEITVIAPESLLLPSGEIPIYEKVKVRALLRTDVPDIDGHALFFDYAQGLKRLRDTASLERGTEIRLNDPDQAPYFARRFEKAGFHGVKTWQEMNSALFYSLKMEKTLMGLFLGLTILVSSFSIVAVLVLMVTEKRADVGILKAIGATKARIRSIFMSLGLALGLVGILSGVVLGLGICWVLKTYPILRLPDIYYDTSVPVSVQKGVILGIILLGALLTLLGTLIPAWRVAEADPIESMRHDGG